jgi:hypothetical protein
MANVDQMQAIASHKVASIGLDGNGICFSTYLLANYLYFRVFDCDNLFKLASAGQFAETDQNSQHGQDVSHRCTCQPGGLNRDPFFVRDPTQTD